MLVAQLSICLSELKRFGWTASFAKPLLDSLGGIGYFCRLPVHGFFICSSVLKLGLAALIFKICCKGEIPNETERSS